MESSGALPSRCHASRTATAANPHPHPNPNPIPNQAEFENPYILLVEKKVSTLQTLLPLLEQARYLVITPMHRQTLLPLLEQARYLVITPMHRQTLLP